VAASITICNLALGELRASAIADIAEDSIEAQNCARYYPQCLKLLLERHDWSFATRIASLAELSNNPRASEWLHAYALPADCATPKRLVPPVNGGLGCWPVEWGQAFIVEAGLLYTQLPGAILEYSSDDVPEAVMPALFADALAYALAARLAVPIRDSREMKGQLLQQAELAAMRAVADDENREPQRDIPFSDEVMAARSGGFAGWVG
jgi:hypothetical protein